MIMKRQLILGIALLVLISAPDAQTTTIYDSFALQGYGSFMDDNPTWSGNLTAGTLSPGTFWMEIDDSCWPADDPGTPENERWDYIFSNYFSYNDTEGAECWDAFFPNTDLGDSWIEWRFMLDNGDIIGGTSGRFIVTVQDLNANGIMEDSEYQNKVCSGTLISWINFGAGSYAGFCGDGSFSGQLNVTDQSTMEEELYVPSPTWATGMMTMTDEGCSTATENSSWGAIKSLYKE